MNAEGMIFDIKEFALYDGPGIRTTVFLKGCPLRCKWCHNPEGLSPNKQLMVSIAACVHCGECEKRCAHETCVACGDCVPYCKAGLRKICGESVSARDLAGRLLAGRALWQQTGGGVTFSGGEPLMQWAFLRETISLLEGAHVAVETSGFAPEAVFRDMLSTVDFVMMDVKHMDDAEHRKWTGVGNREILANARALLQSGKRCVMRVPLIPGVNDGAVNLEATAAFIAESGMPERVELLPYHQTAGAKYEMVGMAFHPPFDTAKAPNVDTRPFASRGIPVLAL